MILYQVRKESGTLRGEVAYLSQLAIWSISLKVPVVPIPSPSYLNWWLFMYAFPHFPSGAGT
jgi:hypothetical protein